MERSYACARGAVSKANALVVAAVLSVFAVGVPVDQTVIEALRIKAEQGDAAAQNRLGQRYNYGLAVPQDYAEALKWYRLAAEQGVAEAVERYRMAAQQGDASAQFNLAVMYDHGRGVPRDDAEAAKWVRMAAEQGHAHAQYYLSSLYGAGKGVPQDPAEAVKWLRMAAVLNACIDRPKATGQFGDTVDLIAFGSRRLRLTAVDGERTFEHSAC